MGFGMEKRQDNGVAFDEYFARLVLGQQLADGIIEVQAEVRSWVESLFEESPRQGGGLADIGFHDHMVDHSLFFCRPLLLEKEKLIKRVVDGRELAEPFA